MTVLDIGFDHVEAEDQPCSWEAIKRLSMAIDESVCLSGLSTWQSTLEKPSSVVDGPR